MLSTLTDPPRRVPCDDDFSGNILHYDCTSADDGSCADDDPGSYEGIGTNPCLVTDGDGDFEQRHGWIAKVVASPAEMSSLGDGHFFADGDWTQIVDERIEAN